MTNTNIYNIGMINSRALLTGLNILLVAAIAYKLSGLAFTFIDDSGSYKDTGFDRSASQRSNVQQQPSSGRQQDELETASHLFGMEVQQEKLTPVIETTLQLTLRGVFAVADPTKGLAIIGSPTRSEKYFVAGQDIFAQARLKEVYDDRVILFRNGRYETLRLPEKALAAMQHNNSRSKRMSRDEYARKHVEYMRGKMKDIHKMTLNRMRNPWQYLYFEPALVDGKIMGLKLTAEEEKGFLAKHGIELGDIITSINGQRLDGGAGVARALNEIGQADDLDLVIDRSGESKTLHIKGIQEHQSER